MKENTMLETEIKKLTAAVETLTAVLGSELENITTATPELIVDNTQPEPEPEGRTTTEVRELAKELIALEKVTRKDVKTMIEALGCDGINDLDADGLSALWDALGEKA
jgi:hypothetical protein